MAKGSWIDGAEVEEQPAEAAKPDKAKDDGVTLTKAEHAALIKERDEARSSEKFWADRARNTRNEVAEIPEENDDDDDEDDEEVADDSPDKLTDDLTTNGIIALQKRGLMTKKAAKAMIAKALDKAMKEVDTRVNTRVTAIQKQMVDDATLTREFPQLLDETSEMSAATAREYRELIKEDPDLKNRRSTLRTAAKLAKASIRPKVDEAARQRRIASQAGDPGGMGGGDDDDDEALSPFQKDFLRKMNADGGDQISEEAYTKRAKKGSNHFRGGNYEAGSMNWK
jgi:hypothetical protein